jgi:hypothetical protein
VHSGASGDVTAVVAVGKNGGWAFNGVSGPTAWERDGATWIRVAFPGRSGEEVVAAGAPAASNVWAFTDGGTTGRALRWNGHRWTAQASFAHLGEDPVGPRPGRRQRAVGQQHLGLRRHQSGALERHVPGTTQVLGGGFRHAAGNPGTGVVSVILQYER